MFKQLILQNHNRQRVKHLFTRRIHTQNNGARAKAVEEVVWDRHDSILAVGRRVSLLESGLVRLLVLWLVRIKDDNKAKQNRWNNQVLANTC